MPFDIVSTSNERIKRLIRLRERSARDEEGVFVVEGQREIGRAIASGKTLLELYGDTDELPDSGERRWSVAPEALARASYRSSQTALIAVFEQFETGLDTISPGPLPLILVAEGLEKPGNLGAILRTAAGFAADGVVALETTVDVFNPNVVRASTGAVFSVPVAVAGLTDAFAWLRRHEITVIAGTTDAAVDLWDVDLTGPTALLVGAEDKGLSSAARASATVTAKIPMGGIVDSLNASVSMALMAYEAIRQRSH